MIWEDLTYEDEHAIFDPTRERPADVVKADTGLLRFYKRLCKMRKDNKVLIYGDLSFTIADDRKMILAYDRTMGNDEIAVIFNRSDSLRS